MRAAITTLALALAACSTNEIRDPSEFTPASALPDEPLFGTLLHEGSLLRRTIISSTFKAGPGIVYIYEGPGWDDELVYRGAEATVYRVDPGTEAGTAIAAPALEPSDSHGFGTAVGDGTAVLMLGRQDSIDVAYFDGSTWTTTAGPPNVGITNTRIIARSASEILVFSTSGVHFFNGSTWRALPMPANFVSDPVPGPWDAGGARIVFRYHQQSVCSALYAPAALASGPAPAATCIDVPNLLIAGSAVNGTTDDFQVLTRTESNDSARAVRFAGATTSVGRAFGNMHTTLLAAPGSTRPLATVYDTAAVDTRSYFPALSIVEGGEVGAQVLDGLRAYAPCACDRNTDPSCGCYARDAALVLGSTDASGAQLGLVFVDDIDGRRRITVRVLALPFEGAPFPAPECDLVCTAPAVCEVNPVTGDSSCVIPDPTAGIVETYVDVTPADPALAGGNFVTYTLTPTNPTCGVSYMNNGGSQYAHVDPYCTFTLDASAPGHVSLQIPNLESGSENTQLNIGPHKLARGALLDDAPLPSSNFVDNTRLVVAPGGGKMLLDINGEWRWVAASASAPYFTVTGVVAASNANTSFGLAFPRWVSATRAIVHTDAAALALVENGAVLSTLTGSTFDQARAAYARNASVALVPSGTAVASAIHPGVSSAATFVQYAGSTITAARTITTDGFGHTIRANGADGAFFDTFGRLVLVDTGTTTTVVSGSWSNRAGLRAALGGATDWLVVAPNATNPNPVTPCNTLQLCTVWAQEDIPGDPGDPVTRQTVSLSTRALWAEIGESVGHVAWLERDTSNLAHLYRRDTTTQTTTEISLGGSYAQDIAHAVVGDKLLVMVPAGIVVLDIATGASRLETGTFANNAAGFEPLVRVDDSGTVFLREACVLGTDPCGMRLYDATTDTFTALARAVYPRFGTASDRAVDGGMTVTVYDSATSTTAQRSYTLAGGTTNFVETAFRTSRVRGAPCIVYWRAEPADTTVRRWYCSD